MAATSILSSVNTTLENTSFSAGAFPGAQQRDQGREPGPDQIHRQQLRWPGAASRGKADHTLCHLHCSLSEALATNAVVSDRLSQSRGCAKLIRLDVLGFLQDAAKRQFADELIAYADAFTKALYSPLMAHADVSDEVGK